MTEEHLKDDKKVKFYSGLPSYTVLLAIFNLISQHITNHQCHTITKFQQFMMVLMKLRLDLRELDLSYRFGLNGLKCKRLCQSILGRVLASVLLSSIVLFCERSTGLKARAQTWLNYKHHHTMKCLIGIAPQGAIIFISKGWGGRVSDQHLTQHCGILEYLQPGDQVLADRGFNVQDSARLYCAEVKILPFTCSKKQLSKMEVDKSRDLSRVRIHVEHVIGMLRQRYTTSGNLTY